MERITELARGAGRICLDLLFPRRCPFCGRITAVDGLRQREDAQGANSRPGICADCRQKIRPIGQPYCFLCGRPLQAWDAPYCADCRAHAHKFRQGRALYAYEKEAKNAVHAVKYGNKREYLEYFAAEMAEQLGDSVKKWKPEILLSVPMHKKAQRKRGFNQAQILAEHLGRELELKVCADAICKIRPTANQKELDVRGRRRNLKDAFQINSAYLDLQGKLPWKTVLLADDVYTTGSTIDELSKTLLSAGVESVFFVTICIVPK